MTSAKSSPLQFQFMNALYHSGKPSICEIEKPVSVYRLPARAPIRTIVRRIGTRVVCAILFLCGLAACRPCPAQTKAASGVVPIKLTPEIRADVAEKYADELARVYTYPEKATAMADLIRQKLKAGAYDNLTSPIAFAEALAGDARTVSHDLHLRINYAPPSSTQPVMMMMGGPQTPEMLELMRAANGDIPQAKILDGNIGYLIVNGQMTLNDTTRAAIAAAFQFLRNTSALIIDLRGDGGGQGFPAYWMSYLSEGPSYVVNTMHWRQGNQMHEQDTHTEDVGAASYGEKKPVFALTSSATFSAGEEFAYDLQAFKRGTLVGQITGGGANPTSSPMGDNLGHGFSAVIPTGYVENPVTKSNWEGAGVKPDVEVPAGQALDKAWALAIEKIEESTTDPQTKAWLDAFSTAKLSGTPTLSTAELVGTYSSGIGFIPVSIIEKPDGLYRQLRRPGATIDARLVPEGGDRYSLDGFPYGYSPMTFVKLNGKIDLLLNEPQIAEKQK